MDSTQIVDTARQVGAWLLTHELMLATAESCTGGLVSAAITEIAGSSAWFDRGFVTYTNESKKELLGVHADTLAQFGAVSETTAREMALGALTHSKAHIAVAITGIAGPTGGSPDKPVGTVCFAWAHKLAGTETAQVSSTTHHFTGDRASVRQQAAQRALSGITHLDL